VQTENKEMEKSRQHSIKQFGLMRKLIWLLAMPLNTRVCILIANEKLHAATAAAATFNFDIRFY